MGKIIFIAVTLIKSDYKVVFMFYIRGFFIYKDSVISVLESRKKESKRERVNIQSYLKSLTGKFKNYNN